MVTDAQFTDLKNKVKGLEEKLDEVGENTGGILSGGDIRDRILYGDEGHEYLDLFKKRKWKDMKKKWPERNDGKPGWNKRIVITNYNDLNVTPFSYDLSLGKQVFSTKRPGMLPIPLQNQQPYLLEPGETVVVITEELVAIPHAYSATVWPRFNMVKRGVFQSMVKIDPTWYGKLAVAISNLSPAEVELNHGEAFATLLFYELSKPSDIDLWNAHDLLKQNSSSDVQCKFKIQVEQDIPTEFRREIHIINRHITDADLRDCCWITGTKIISIGIKNKESKKLKKCFQKSQMWENCVDQLAKKWTDKLHPKTENRMVVMEALGMNDLWDIVKNSSDDGYLHEEDVRDMVIDNSEDLVQAAITRGKPFDLLAKMPETIIQRIKQETVPRIEAEIESKIQLRVTLLVFSLFGFLSLAVAMLLALWKMGQSFFNKHLDLELISRIIWPISALVAVGFFLVTLNIIRSRAQESARGRSGRKKQKKLIKELRKEKKKVEKKHERTNKKLSKRLSLVEAEIENKDQNNQVENP